MWLLTIICTIIQGPFTNQKNEISIAQLYENQKESLENDVTALNYIFELRNEDRFLISNISFEKIYETKDSIVILTREKPEKEIIRKSKFYDHDNPKHIKQMRFNDPAFQFQFPFYNTGEFFGFQNEDINIMPVWNKGILGHNITLTVVDSGCRTTHVEFSNRFNKDLNLNLKDGSTNVEAGGSDPHGTMCLGAAAASTNDYCIVGAAPNSTLACHKYESTAATVSNFLKSFSASKNIIDVTSNSWALQCDITATKRCYNYQNHPSIKLVADDIPNTRNNLGRIVVFSAGNDGMSGEDTNSYLFNGNRHFIAVSASNFKGAAAYYSSFGSCVLVNAPSGGQGFYSGLVADSAPFFETVDSLSDTSCSSTFSGSSASAPVVAGITALILEVNPRLTWRDMQALLAITATINDPKHHSWSKNGAGYLYSHYYGFGRANADLAVETAKIFKTLPEEANTILKYDTVYASGYRTKPEPIIFDIDPKIKFIESVVITFSMDSDISTLVMDLESPTGTVSHFKRVSNYVQYVSKDLPYEFTLRNFFGESSKGKWKLLAYSTDPFVNHTMKDFKIEFFGCSKTPELPKVNKQIGHDSSMLVPEGKNNELTMKATSREMNCGEDVEIEFDSNNTFAEKYFNLFFKHGDTHTNIAGISNYDTRFSVTIPCLFKTLEGELEVQMFRSNLSASLPLKVYHHHNISNNRITEPAPNTVVKSGSKFTVKWETFDNNVSTLWGQRAVLRLYDYDTHEIKFSDTNFWNRGSLDIAINDSIVCPRCLLSISPGFGDYCSTMSLPIKIIKEGDEIPADMDFTDPVCVSDQPPNIENSERKLMFWLIIAFLALFFIVDIILVIYYCIIRRKPSEETRNDSLQSMTIFL